MTNFTPREKISKAIIDMQVSHPFWSRLILNMQIRPDTKNEIPEYGGASIDANGHMLYKESFIESLSVEQCSFVLAHEVSHGFLNHLIRLGNRDMIGYNIACDLVVNDLLRANGFKPCEGAVIPENNHSFKAGDKTIADINKKIAEQVYDELPEESKKGGMGEGGFDHHIFSKDLTEQQKKDIAEKMSDALIDAATYAKAIGIEPIGMERYIKEILQPKINWKNLLYRYIIQSIPSDYSFSRPNKKSYSLGVYLPYNIKEAIDVVVHIDSSGSIGQKELEEFTSEMISIAKSFNNISMTIIVCDCVIQGVYPVENGNIEKIKTLQIKGFGGTSHKPVFEWIEENKPDCKILISLTDGQSDIDKCEKPNYPVIWCINNQEQNIEPPFGHTIYIN